MSISDKAELSCKSRNVIFALLKERYVKSPERNRRQNILTFINVLQQLQLDFSNFGNTETLLAFKFYAMLF